MCLGRHKCCIIVVNGSITGCRVAAAIWGSAHSQKLSSAPRVGEVVEPARTWKVLSTLSSSGRDGDSCIGLLFVQQPIWLLVSVSTVCIKRAAIVRRSIPAFNGSSPDWNNNWQRWELGGSRRTSWSGRRRGIQRSWRIQRGRFWEPASESKLQESCAETPSWSAYDIQRKG